MDGQGTFTLMTWPSSSGHIPPDNRPRAAFAKAEQYDAASEKAWPVAAVYEANENATAATPWIWNDLSVLPGKWRKCSS